MLVPQTLSTVLPKATAWGPELDLGGTQPPALTAARAPPVQVGCVGPRPGAPSAETGGGPRGAGVTLALPVAFSSGRAEDPHCTDTLLGRASSTRGQKAPQGPWARLSLLPHPQQGWDPNPQGPELRRVLEPPACLCRGRPALC